MTKPINILPITAQLAIHMRDIEETFIQANGPGGQNVNKVASAVQLRFYATRSQLPKSIIDRLLKLAGQRATKDGHILIEASRFRTQERNRIDARDRLVRLIRRAAETPQQRKPTRPPKAAIKRRLQNKANRSTVKQLRQKIKDNEN